MKVKVPNKIKIAARTYDIVFRQELLRDEGNRGQVWWHKQLMELAPNLHPEQEVVSFLHECIHIIDEHMAGRSNITEETTCSLAEGIYQLLKDNLGIELDLSDIHHKP